MLRLDLETSLDDEEVFDVLEYLHLLQESGFASFLVDKVLVIFTTNRIVGPFKV